MHSSEELHKKLQRISGKGYKAYKDLQGDYFFKNQGFRLSIDHVQGDPFAGPTKVRVLLPREIAAFPEDTFSNKVREISTRDFVTRQFQKAIRNTCKGNRGTGKSGAVSIDIPGQEVLERTSVLIGNKEVEVRFTIGLPAFGRKIAGREAMQMFFNEIPELVEAGLIFDHLDIKNLYNQLYVTEDAEFIRSKLSGKGLVAFVANDAILPRATGIDPRLLKGENVIPFSAPGSMEISFNLPNQGAIRGMAIPEGINLIVGGGFHGKSTLLEALEQGIYNHIPGDGREFVISRPDAVKIRAEDGRRIEKTDISPFITNLPFEKSTKAFCTENASGSTSQAANIIEAVESGAGCLLIDEDTSATNFMIRDQRMQSLVAKDKEPITPFIDKVKQLYKDLNISTILVMGGSGDYFEVAGKVTGMYNYRPYDYTGEAKAIVKQGETQRETEGGTNFGTLTNRCPLPQSLDPSKGKKMKKIRIRGKTLISFGHFDIDLASVEQITDKSQTNAIGDALYYATRYMDGKRPLKEILDQVFKDIHEKGLNIIGSKNGGNYAYFRRHELAAALNRLRALKVKQL